MVSWELIYEPGRVAIGALAEILVVAGGSGLDLRYGSRVYAAYLDRECRLLRVYGIEMMNGEDSIAAVARDAREQNEVCQVIVGPAAELLFLAVTGRLASERVTAANPLRSLQARSILAFGVDREPGCAEAYAAVADWGDHIKPWYGAVALDARGRLLLDLPEYDECVDLPMVVAAG